MPTQRCAFLLKLCDGEVSAAIYSAGVCGAPEKGVFQMEHVKWVLDIRGTLDDFISPSVGLDEAKT